MSTTFASLGIAVESSQAVKAADDLDKLVDAAAGAEKAIDDLGKTGAELADTGKKIVQAETDVAQGIDKTTGARERQAGASRKAADSAVSEISIIRNLNNAMERSGDSYTSLATAGDLLNKARAKGLVTAEDELEFENKILASHERLEKAAAKEMAQKQRLIEAENRRIDALKRTVNGIDPVTNKLAKLEAREKALNELHKIGEYDAKRYSDALAKIGKDRAGLTEATGAFDKLKLGTRQAQENVVQLGNALSSGDWGSGVRAVAQLGAGAGASAAGLLATLAPLALATAAVGGLGYAYYKGSEEQDAFNKSLILTGGSAGFTSSQLGAMARQVSDTVGTTGQAAEVLATLAGNGKIAGESFLGITQAAVSMQEATGKAVGETIAEFVKLSDEPVKASAALNEQYHYLTASVYSQIVALKEQGNHAGAVKLATEQYADGINERTPRILENLSLWEKGYNLVAKAADSLKNAGRETSNAERIQTAKEALGRLEARGGSERIPGEDPVYIGEKGKQSLRDYIKGLEVKDAAETEAAKKKKARDEIELAGQKAMEKVDALTKSSWTNEQKRADALKEYRRQLDDIRKADPKDKRLDQSVVDKNIANINDKFKDSKAAAGSVDLTSFNDAKNQLASIVAEYSNVQKQLEAAQKAGLISQAEYAQKRDGLIGNERDEVTAAYEAEIAALEAVKNKSSTTAAQRIQLDQKIADARTAMVKAQKDADSQQEVLATAEKGRLDKQTYAISQYVAALGQQQKALELAGQRAVNGVGQGDRQNALSGELNSQQDRFAQQSLELENQRSDPSRNMSDEEFTRKSQALADANKAATDQIRQNYADVEAAQGDWTKGATSAWANYLDSAQNVAGQTKSLFGNAFSSMEDAVVNFAMTGKLSFADFTKSILADMARIAARQASSALLSSLVGAGISYFTGSGTGATGAATAGGAEAGAQSFGSQFDASSASVNFGGGRASGGGVDPNTLYEVNEKGPELFSQGGRSYLMTGAAGGSVTPLTTGGGPGVAAMGGGGGTTVSLSMPIMVMTDQESGRPDGAELDTEAFQRNMQERMRTVAKEEIAKSWRQGGASYRQVKG
ncbi:phage tail tape measure protein [Pseudomonas sp. 6D_7.1_Bac1]|uniref:phage tail tape measure protein n=1 Tax=Pseudomonas sp. 6D_7.1_Bac1 TaxID=2971615 RepID=UPI0021C90511|nr:phage tail tape measure protein [Pseudomonas sp. 6D_7.1_Bac1]MCU1752145.1 phage tail tape measure protein [Pseudomonas sp. 6D_7.1_Bac1]